MPAFTIITVCLNIASTIKRTCESIVHQPFQDFQGIVVDGASTDGTLDILKEYSSRINILISEPDKGIYNAMNKGIKHATGEYINFMNGGDEFYNNNVLENVFLNKTFKGDIIYGDEYKIKNGESYLFKNWETITEDILFNRYGITHQSSFTKTIILKKYGFNDEYTIAADFDFFVRVFKKRHSFSKIPIIINKFYEDGISSTNEYLNNLEYQEIKRKNFKTKVFLLNHPKIIEFIVFITNSVKYPRYFLGWFKRIIIKQKAES
ncbi:MAG: glycosyltransferase [Alphaproteobacteria bacterium]|nr:glycosyltransferase [Alphaproteobacteria bacterium]